MDDIDDEALAKAAYEAFTGAGRVRHVHPWEACGPSQANVFRLEVRAVVAALRDQGMVVVRADDVAWLLSREQGNLRLATRDSALEDRIRAALAAPEPVGEVR